MSKDWRRWAPGEVDDFMTLLSTGRTFADVCKSFGRSEAAARKHLTECGAIKTVKSRLGHLGYQFGKAIGPPPPPVALPTKDGDPLPNGRDDGCQWIFGATGRAFCGQPTVHSSSWCETHYARCFIAISPKANGHDKANQNPNATVD
jgi:hypothetical protein